MIGGFGIYFLLEAQKTGGAVTVVLPAFITGFGLLLFLIGFLGCFGACTQNVCMLKTVKSNLILSSFPISLLPLSVFSYWLKSFVL